jgi:cell division protein FtsZ
MVEELLMNGSNGAHESHEQGNTYETARVIHSERAPARIKVVGVGGGGCNCIRRMMRYGRVPGVSFAMVNTDIKALETYDHDVDLIQIGEKSTRGWGAGGDFKCL